MAKVKATEIKESIEGKEPEAIFPKFDGKLAENNFSNNFLKHDEVKLSDIRLIGGLFNSFLEKAQLQEKFKEMGEGKTLIDFQYVVTKSLYNNDEAFKEFNVLINYIIKYDIERLKGDELQNTLNYCFAFIQKITSQGFFSNITTWFLTAIKG